MRSLFPEDISSVSLSYRGGSRGSGMPRCGGRYVDEWGCVWDAGENGVVGEVKNAVIEDWALLDTLRPPREILEGDWPLVDATRASTDCYILAVTSVRPFERMQFLRGTENLFMDMAWGDARFKRLRALVHEFFLEELTLWISRDVDGISFMDDWGTQYSLLINPNMWREYFKPLYMEYVRIIHRAGKHAFFHSDGNIEAIFPDLVEIGVDAINCQLFCMDIEELGRKFKGEITFWGEIDRQKILPFGTPSDVRAAVMRVRVALENATGGVIAQCEWGNRDPFANIAAVFSAWSDPLASASVCASKAAPRGAPPTA